jgi:DNA-binding response OmpR family regulator
VRHALSQIGTARLFETMLVDRSSRRSWLPSHLMPPTMSSDRSAEELHGKVLYIEDMPINFAVVEANLARHPGVTLIHAATGLEGVRLVRSELPDFVLLDMHLPDISGLDVVRLLSEDIATHQLRITILTADSLSMDIIKAMSLGAFEYLVKPVEVSVLEASVRRALNRNRTTR